MMQSHWLSILGIGEDGVASLSGTACRLISEAVLVVGGARHLRLASMLITGATMEWPHPISQGVAAVLARRGDPVVVLASGDPFFHGVGSLLAAEVPREEFLCVPVASSASLAAARLGWAVNDTPVVSCCGAPVARLISYLHDGGRLLVLSADARTPAEVTALLCARGFGGSRVHVLEALGGPRERVRMMHADCDLPDEISPLNMLALELVAGPDAAVVALGAGLPDQLFAHDGQITKAEVRAATLAALAPTPGAMLWDIGCGSGSVAIEWLRAHPANRAIGLERDAERAVRARGNATSLGVPQFDVLVGEAPADIGADWRAPDAVFIGGGAQGEGVIAACWDALRSGGRLVVNAVTIETEAVLFAAHRDYGGGLTRLSIDRLDPVGRLQGFRPAMTVTQWRGVKP